MKWYFPPQLPGQVETEVTQRDQFSNDDVELAETIVRESIQNSLDAAIDDPPKVRVEFRWLGTQDGLQSDFINQLLKEQLVHAKVAGLSIDNIDFTTPTAIVIEDFGTKGLTGSIDHKDEDNFSDFWRRHGKSHKSGKKIGRWGLGKLVYSTTSQVGVFFGATVTQKEADVRLMGQTVLNLRTVDGVEYPPHAFFADIKNEGDIYKETPIPIQDTNLVSKFEKQFQLKRGSDSGLSVMIPFYPPEFNFERMISVAIENYFYAVITGQLKLQFQDIEINSNNIRELAHEYAHDRIENIDELFDFIEEVFIAEAEEMLSLKQSWINDTKLDEDDFNPEDLDKIRNDFALGELVGLNLPLEIKLKNGDIQETSFSIYVKKPKQLGRGHDLYVRGGLTLPGEAKFRDRKAFGAMIAEKEEICAFLGDAENAAHTQWVSSAEKLRKNYQAPGKIVKVIKNSVVDLYDLLAEVTEETDEQALAEFFWKDEPVESRVKKRPKKTPVVIPPIPEPRVQDFRISATEDGFAVISSDKTTADRFPQFIEVKMAYDAAKGNPFSKYSPFDFTLGGNSAIKLSLTKDTGKITSRKENIIKLVVTGVPFKLKATGFDVHRDLKVMVNREL